MLFLTLIFGADIVQRTWEMLIFSKHLQSIEDIMFRYHLAESLVRIALVNNHQLSTSTTHSRNDFGHDLAHRMPLVCDLVDMCEQSVAAPSSSERERSFAAIVLLVVLKQCQEAFSGKFGRALDTTISNPFTAATLHRIAVVFLLVIRGPTQQGAGAGVQQEPFAQDVCCAGLCRVYDIALSVGSSDTRGNTMEMEDGSGDLGTINSKKAVSEKIASLVISTMCREKKAIQAAGCILICLSLNIS
jgi:hypothetical protein